jgi:hypothetical protein
VKGSRPLGNTSGFLESTIPAHDQSINTINIKSIRATRFPVIRGLLAIKAAANPKGIEAQALGGGVKSLYKSIAFARPKSFLLTVKISHLPMTDKLP